MARKILCPECDAETSKNAKRFDELYESIGGLAKEGLNCDNCGIGITKGEVCFASVLLPDSNHPNYKIQKPSSWGFEYIDPNN